MAPKIKITYFNGKGRAESTRLALVVGGIDFEDERIKGEEFAKRKANGDFVFGSLPAMTVIDGDNKASSYAQSDAMLRYCGKLAGLYPTSDHLNAMQIDMVVGALEDVVIDIFKDNSLEGRTKFTTEGIPKYFNPIEKM